MACRRELRRQKIGGKLEVGREQETKRNDAVKKIQGYEENRDGKTKKKIKYQR